jgi:hypothetical protein
MKGKTWVDARSSHLRCYARVLMGGGSQEEVVLTRWGMMEGKKVHEINQ